MKSYLGLIPIAEKKHKKQSRMTRVCIILAVFLVTAIFSMAEMEMRNQLRQAIREDGYWHISIRNITPNEVAYIRENPGIDFACAYGVINYRLTQQCMVNGTDTVLCGFDESFFRVYSGLMLEGEKPTALGEAVISTNMVEQLNKKIGDTVEVTLADGSMKELTITGIVDSTSMLSTKDCYGIDVSTETFTDIFNQGSEQLCYFVAVKDGYDIRSVINELKDEYAGTDVKIGENLKLLGILGKSEDNYMMTLYIVAALLAAMVVTAGVLMITSSINSNLSKRTQFFGMLRCQGATKKQVKKFVTLEALNWCKTAIPIGIVMGMVVTWMLCALLRVMSPSYFADMPICDISLIGIVLGGVIGLVTVLLAAISPAKKASKVSPLTAVTGNAYCTSGKHLKMHLRVLPIDIRLGISHSYKSKKNFLLMIFSFAFSIILFLAFSTGIDFLHHALRPVKVYTPDISVYESNQSCELPKDTVERLVSLTGVKKVYGRSFLYNLTAKQNTNTDVLINLVSYEEQQFEWSEKSIVEGNIEQVITGKAVMTVYDVNSSLRVGDLITITTETGEHTLPIGAIISDSPFTKQNGVETVVCSEKAFEIISGDSDYTIIDLQVASGISEETVNEIRTLFPDSYVFSDKRSDNDSVRGAYLSMSVFIYGFIAIIALISIFQVMNSVAMSANAQIHEYGAMRAIGATIEQISRMITSEALSYGVFGILLGTVLGLLIHKGLYESLITQRWGDSWTVPVNMLSIILIVIAVSCGVSVIKPIRSLKQMSITDTLATF